MAEIVQRIETLAKVVDLRSSLLYICLLSCLLAITMFTEHMTNIFI